MQELYNIGIGEITFKTMLEINPELKELSNNEILEKKIILRKIGCNDDQLLNIISSNPIFLSRTNGEIIKLIDYLRKLGFNHTNILFDANPYILNLEPFEIDNYINDRINNGELFEDIIDDLDSNPYLFSEM